MKMDEGMGVKSEEMVVVNGGRVRNNSSDENADDLVGGCGA